MNTGTKHTRGLWIAVEGLDGVGKSTLVEALCRELRAELITNPPASLAGARAAADTLPRADRRAWYLQANDVAAREAHAARDAGSMVVMDRSVASTLVFGAAERGEIATAGSWPDGMPVPDMLVYLELDEAQRRARITGRDGTRTEEEGRLARDDDFRDRVGAGYRALCHTCVDASATPEAVLRSVLALIDPSRPAARRRFDAPRAGAAEG